MMSTGGIVSWIALAALIGALIGWLGALWYCANLMRRRIYEQRRWYNDTLRQTLKDAGTKIQSRRR